MFSSPEEIKTFIFPTGHTYTHTELTPKDLKQPFGQLFRQLIRSFASFRPRQCGDMRRHRLTHWPSCPRAFNNRIRNWFTAHLTGWCTGNWKLLRWSPVSRVRYKYRTAYGTDWNSAVWSKIHTVHLNIWLVSSRRFLKSKSEFFNAVGLQYLVYCVQTVSAYSKEIKL